jgi:hypothetical protein
MDGGGERTLLSVKDGATIRFWSDTRQMEQILGGGALQLSAFGGFCTLEVSGDRVELTFSVEGFGTKRCAFSTSEFRDSIAWVRTLPTPLQA